MIDLKVSKTRRAPVNAAVETESEDEASVTMAGPNTDEVRHMVAVAAYYLAERRNFEPGHELNDWLTAEAQISSELESQRF
jgi:Protein of unknown function (DUF2934)